MRAQVPLGFLQSGSDLEQVPFGLLIDLRLPEEACLLLVGCSNDLRHAQSARPERGKAPSVQRQHQRHRGQVERREAGCGDLESIYRSCLQGNGRDGIGKRGRRRQVARSAKAATTRIGKP